MLTQRHNSFAHWNQRFIAGAAVLFVCVLFAPQQAQASCGDYVMIGGHLDSDGASMMDSGHAVPKRGIPVCRGLGCRERREVPASPPTRLTLDEHFWGLPPRLSSAVPERHHFSDRSAEPVVAVFYATDVFRPPRPASAV